MKVSRKTSGSRAALLAASLTREGAGGGTTTIRRSAVPPATLAIAIAIFAAFLLAAPRAAHATESPFCGGQVVAPKQTCSGASRTFNASLGWGEQGSVCVGNGVSGVACSGGPNEGVYKPVGQWITTQPWISNNLSNQNNRVHGIAYTP